MRQREFEHEIGSQRARLLRVAVNLVGEHSAPDVVQNAMETVFKSEQWKRLDAGDDFARYLTTSVQNAAKMHLRSDERRLEQEAMFAAELPLHEGERDDALDVRYALSTLPEDVARALWAVHVEEVSWDAVAAELGVPRPTLQKRVAKWLPFLKEQLG